jgi:sugar phosphate isomerase/epimerase
LSPVRGAWWDEALMAAASPIYLASIALEPNRWRPGRIPSMRASAWSERARAAGFDGWELFENHYVLAPPEERDALRSSAAALPVRVFNSYAAFDDTGSASRVAAAEAVRALDAPAMKFNVGNDPAQLDESLRAIEATAKQLGENARLWCECHPDTWFEEPERLIDAATKHDWSTWPFDVIIHPFLFGPEKIVQWGRLLGPRLRHAHVQMRAHHDPTRFLQLADDAPRARECLTALALIGFEGSFSIEFTSPTSTPDDAPEKLFLAACRDLEFLREEWRPPSRQ